MKHFTWLYSIALFLCQLVPEYAEAQISGLVFRDLNANGVKDSTTVFYEPGVGGVTVTAFNSAGTQVSTTTAVNGSYSLAIGSAGKYRVEFTGFQSKDFDGAIGGSSQSSIRFVDVPVGGLTGVDLGINYPDHYSNGSPPTLFTPCYVTGNEVQASNEKVFVKWAYTEEGKPQMFGGSAQNPQGLANLNQLGTVWGLAYNRQKQEIYTAAFLKRHTILLNNSNPDNGLGNIFLLDPNNGNPSVLFNLYNLGIDVGTIPDNATRGITGGTSTPSQDSIAYDKVGKLGIGDIDISTDNKTLWIVVVNEANPRLVAVTLDSDNNPATVPTASDVKSWPITLPCTGGTSRPFGLKYYRGQLYVGIVCDASTSQNTNDLSATVLRFDPATQAFANVLQFPLNYTKGIALTLGACAQYTGWYPWTNDYTFPPVGTTVCSTNAGNDLVRPTPMLSDIEFDVEGSMILGFTDRWGNQVGNGNYSPLGGGFYDVVSTGGDILRAAPDGSGGYVIENNGTSGGITTASANNGDGIGGGEYYNDNYAFHHESAQGGIAMWPGSGEVISTALDPIDAFTGGIRKFNNTTGVNSKAYQIFAGGFGKANGLGDLETAGSEAPVQIGNRVWKDEDGDGIQDPQEPPLAGVTVALYENCTGSAVATATTDANGNYYFSSASGTSTSSTIYGLTLNYNTAYCLKVTSLGSDPSVSGLTLTVVSPANGETSGSPNSGATSVNSDAFVESGFPTIHFTIGNAGENNYTYDFGFPSCVKPNAGQNLKICAPATSANLSTAAVGQTWSQLGTSPAVASINAAGQVTGLTVDGTYLFVLSAGEGCTDTVSITRNSVNVAITGPTIVCSTELPVSYTATPSGGSFSSGLPAGVTVSGNVLTISAAAALSSLEFDYTYTDPTTNCSATASKSVTINNGGTKINIATDTLCINQTSTYTDPSGVTGTWSGPGITDTGNGATLNSSAALTALGVSAPVSFYIYFTQNNGNCSRVDSGLVYIVPRPTVTISGPTTICGNALPTNFTALPIGGSYSLPVGLPAGAVSVNGNILTLNANSGLASLTFSYEYTDQATNCSNTASHTITITSPPNAGSDKTLACSNPVTGLLQSSTVLTGFSPAGGTWSGHSSNPSVATITNLGEISGMTVAGTYRFIYTVNGCNDTIAVVVEPCTGCVKPNAGADVAICQPETTAKLTAVTPSGVWTAQAGNPANATIDNAGNITGLSVNGTYYFIYSVTLGGQTCTDTAAVVRREKPAASIVSPANGEVCTSTGTAQLSATPINGSWSVLGAPAGVAVTNNGQVTGLTSVGIYQFIYTLNGCSDTVLVTVKNCEIPCPKPTIALVGSPLCSADNASFSLTFTITGQTGTVKVSAGTLSGSNPFTVTGIPNQTVLKITDSLSNVCVYDTLVSGPNCNCIPIIPTVISQSLTACIGDTFPTLKTTIVGAAVAEWFDQPSGGTLLFSGLSYKPSGTVATTKIFYVQARSSDSNCSINAVSQRVAVTVNAQNCDAPVDLALKKMIDKRIVQLGDSLTYTIKVWNESANTATGVEVTDSLASTVALGINSLLTNRGTTTVSGNVIKWTIGTIAAGGDTVTLSYRVKAIQEGVHFNTAEITKTNEHDIDSTPGNGKEEEDDLDRQCFTVPIKLCTGEKVQVKVSDKYNNVQWFKQGTQGAVASGNEVLFAETGTYTFTASNALCPVEGCCPVIILPGDNCCPPNLCIPLTLKKKKKPSQL